MPPCAAPCSPLRQPTGVVKTVCRGPAMLVLWRNDEAGVLHTEWAENTPLENRPERAAFDSRDQESKQVRRSPVIHRASRLVNQRQTGESPNPVVGSHIAVDIAAERFAISSRDGTSMKASVGQAGSMGEQVFERNGVGAVLRFVQRTVRRLQDAHL